MGASPNDQERPAQRRRRPARGGEGDDGVMAGPKGLRRLAPHAQIAGVGAVPAGEEGAAVEPHARLNDRSVRRNVGRELGPASHDLARIGPVGFDSHGPAELQPPSASLETKSGRVDPVLDFPLDGPPPGDRCNRKSAGDALAQDDGIAPSRRV
jgi:hypothetical protein